MGLPQNPLEAKYEEGRSYLVAGGLLNAIIRVLRLQNFITGDGLRETGTPMGRVLRATGGGGGGGAPAAACIPWSPTFFVDGGVDKVSFHLGTLSGVAPGNWNAEHTIDAGDTYWVVLDVTASAGVITGCEIALDSTPPSSAAVEEGTPPGSFKVVLGVIDELEACMVANTMLTALGAEVFKEGRTPPAEGAEPFVRWWTWDVRGHAYP